MYQNKHQIQLNKIQRTHCPLICMDPEKQTPTKTLMMLQCGYADLNFDEPVEQAIFIAGNTRAGKTTLLHYLLHSVLVGVNGDHSKIVYKVKETSELLKKAIIGDKERQSQTQIPNVVKVKIDGKQTHLIDLPGYQDTYGCFRAVSNNLFIHKIFSQVKRIKFVIVTKYGWLRDTATVFRMTMKSFLNTFSNVKNIGQQISNCVSIVVTNCPTNMDQDGLIALIKELTIMHTQYDPEFAVIKQRILANKAVFKFAAAALGELAEPNDKPNKLLDEIIQSLPNWWTRKIDPSTKKVSMDKIKIHLLDVLEGDKKKFMNELESLSKYLAEVFNKYLKEELISIVKQFLKDPTSEKIDGFIKSFENVLKSQNKDNMNEEEKYLEGKYDEKWKNESKKMFKVQGLNSSDFFNSVKETPLSLQKMRAFINLQKICKNVLEIQKQRQAKSVILILNEFKNFLQIIVGLARRQQQKYFNQIKFYIYRMYSKIYLIIDMFFMFDTTVKESNQKLRAEQFNYMCITFPSDFKKIFTDLSSQGGTSHLEVAMQYIEKINGRASYQNIKVYDDLLKYIEGIWLEFRNKSSDQLNDMAIDQGKLQKYYDIIDRKIKDIKFKQIEAKMQSVERIVEKNSLVTEIDVQQKKILEKADIFQFDDGNCYEQFLCSNYQYSHLLASYAKKRDELDVALAIYQQLKDAYQVLEIMKLKQQFQKIQTAKQKQQMTNILIDYMKKAYKYNRVELAIEKAQKAFSFAQMIGHREKIEKIGKFLYRICPSPFEEDFDNEEEAKDLLLQKRRYMEFMFNGVNKVSIEPKIIKNLNNIEQKQKAEKSPQKKGKMQNTGLIDIKPAK